MKIYEYTPPEIWRVEFAKNGEKYAYLRISETNELEILSLIRGVATSLPVDIFSASKIKLRACVRKLDGEKKGKYSSGKSISFICQLAPYEFAELVKSKITDK